MHRINLMNAKNLIKKQRKNRILEFKFQKAVFFNEREIKNIYKRK